MKIAIFLVMCLMLSAYIDLNCTDRTYDNYIFKDGTGKYRIMNGSERRGYQIKDIDSNLIFEHNGVYYKK